MMKDYIEQAIRTESPITPELLSRMKYHARGLHAMMGLETEVGEMMDMFKKHIFYGKKFDPINLFEECGDIFWYLALLCNEYAMDFELIMRRNIEKLRARYPEKFTAYDALNRDLEKERKTLE